MKISAHQPDLLPYSGFWYKLLRSDFMDLRIWAQVTKSPGYQRRVLMRDKWVAVTLEPGQSLLVPINEVRIDNRETRHRLIAQIENRYRKAPFYKQRLDDICGAIDAQHSDYLWQFNLGLLVWMRGYLGIRTPFVISQPSQGTKTEGLLSYLALYPNLDTYLSGPGAKKYMSDTTPFEENGIKVEWSKHHAATGDSIVTVLMDYEDPMEVIQHETHLDEEELL